MGQIEWKPSAYHLVQDSPSMSEFPPMRIKALLHSFVMNGGKLVEINETRKEKPEDDPDNPYWQL